MQHGETKFHFSFKAVLFPNSADQVAAWTGEKNLPIGPRCNCVTLQRCCLQRLQEYWAKSFSLHCTPQSQPSDCKHAAHHGAHKGSLQRYNARQADLSSGMCLWRLARELKGKTWEQRQPSFSGSPDLYVGHIAGQAYALVSEKLQRLDQSVGGHDLSRFGQLFSSPKPKKG